MRPDRRECSAAGPSWSLFQRPTGLADGLAPKERRYEQQWLDSPPESLPPRSGSRWFPRLLRVRPGGVRQIAAEYKHRSGGATLVAEARLCQDLARVRPWSAANPARYPRTLLGMKTFVATPATRERDWLVVDATDKTPG